MVAAMKRLGITCVLAVLLGLASAVPPAEGSKRCGSFLADGGTFRVTVFKSGRLKCRTAIKIVKEFRLYGRIIGTDEPYRLENWPGWLCYEGAGGGGCRKGRREASWQVRVTTQ